VGRSRSPTVVCAYLVATARMTPHEAFVAIREKRGIVRPNPGFMRQLDEYAKQLQGGQSGCPAKIGGHVAELTGEAQKELNAGGSSSTPTSISDVTTASDGAL
jgi:hypothetical protein